MVYEDFMAEDLLYMLGVLVAPPICMSCIYKIVVIDIRESWCGQLRNASQKFWGEPPASSLLYLYSLTEAEQLQK